MSIFELAPLPSQYPQIATQRSRGSLHGSISRVRRCRDDGNFTRTCGSPRSNRLLTYDLPRSGVELTRHGFTAHHPCTR